jgi:glycosyltransferase involved in cell wall biosynthesis
MKGKIGQSMSYGLPVVTTTVGSEGMELRDGENALIVANGPAAFAEAVIRLYTDESLWDNISAASRNHIEKNYSVDVVSRKIARLFSDIREEKAATANIVG